MQNFEGKIVAITGAGSGIGRALSLAFARCGARLALSDVDGPALAQTAQSVSALKAERPPSGDRPLTPELHLCPVDVANRDQVFAWADSVAKHFGAVNVIINNAGVSLSAAISEMSLDDFQWLMNINFWGVVHGTQAFLPHLVASGEGHVVNISSLFGIMASPTQAAYNSSKFAVRGFTEALQIEMQLERKPVGVTVVHPGGIRTNIVRSGRSRGTGVLAMEHEASVRNFETKLARTSAESCANQILRGVERNASRVMVGGDAKLLDRVVRCVPWLYPRLIARVVRRDRRLP